LEKWPFDEYKHRLKANIIIDLKKYNMGMWTAFIWLRILPNSALYEDEMLNEMLDSMEG
jgi:hypothetical protein